MKNVAIVGGGKEGLALLPLLIKSADTKVTLIAERNPDALIFKLGKLGYMISDHLKVEISSSLDSIKEKEGLDIIVDTSHNDEIHAILNSFNLEHVDIINPATAKQIWSNNGEEEDREAASPKDDNDSCLSIINEVVKEINNAKDKKELLSMVLRVAASSTEAETGSIMLVDKKDGDLVLEASYSMNGRREIKRSCKLGEGIIGKVAAMGEPLLLSGSKVDAKFDELLRKEGVKSALSVPILFDEIVIGVLTVKTDRSDNAFNQKDLKSLTELVPLGAKIIGLSQEIEEMKHESDRFNFWKKVSGKISIHMPIGKKLEEISKLVASFIKGECAIYTLEKDSVELCLKASSTESHTLSNYCKLSIDEGVEGITAQTKCEVTLRGESSDGEKILYKVYPLLSDEEIVGVFKVLTHSVNIEEDNSKVLDELVPLIAKEIKDAFEEERMSLKASKISAIDEAGLKLISATSFKELSSLIASSSAMIMEAEGSVISLYDKKTGQFTIRAAYGMGDKELRKSILNLDKKLANDVIEKREPLLISDLRKSAYKDEKTNARSARCYPLRHKGSVVGALSLYDKMSKGAFYPIPFKQEDKEILDRFILYAEKAIANIVSIVESRKLISVDKLTNLPNEESLVRRLEDELKRSKRHNDSLTFAFLEVANFNNYVDLYGHDSGNRLVKGIASRLSKSIRAFDVVGRYSDSRFALLLPESDEKGDEILKRLTDQIIAENVGPEGSLPPVSIKIACGLIESNGKNLGVEQLIKSAAEDLENKRAPVA
ncbi:MAG: diguanylate cyclase [Proteobacteria bacterium]|nr:diguanylate cyclase [Pseudomonadota bacterium]